MIALLTGSVASKSPNGLVLDVAGVGYEVHLSRAAFEAAPEVGKTVTLHIYTHVREDAISLYGFPTPEEKALFIKLLKVNGVGPKLALQVLSGLPAHDFVEAVRREDIARLNTIPGIGRKTAERIIIDLKDKLLGMTQATCIPSGMPGNLYDDAISALTNLGYSRLQAERALGKIAMDKKEPLQTIIKNALKELANL